MPNVNTNMNDSKKNPNDEFYTRMFYIEEELSFYKNHLKNKIVYCNCDTPESNFVKFFNSNFDRLELKGFNYSGMQNGIGTDFRSSESVEILKQSDIIITNPPFSLSRVHLQQIIEHNKKFIVIANFCQSYLNMFFQRLKSREWRLGVVNHVQTFNTKNGIKRVNAAFFTNMDHGVEPPFIELTEEYDPIKYPKYDNLDIISVDRYKDIPNRLFRKDWSPSNFFKKLEQKTVSSFRYNCSELEWKTKIQKADYSENRYRIPK